MTRTIESGGKYYTVREDGAITWAQSPVPSGQWRVMGAVTRNNFGGAVRWWSLAEVMGNPREIPWKFKNGKQRTFLRDFDHGSEREWRSPGHVVV